MMIGRIGKTLVSLSLISLLASCNDSDDKVEITEKRVLTVWDNPRIPIVPVMPPEWRQVPGTDMRVSNYRFGKDGQVYISNASGSVIDNVNRWLGQYGQEAITDIGSLEKVTVLATEGVIVEAQGLFAGGMGQLPRENAGLLGAIVDFGGNLLTVKMIGDGEAVMAEKERFIAFCENIQDRDLVMPEDSIKQSPSIPLADKSPKQLMPPVAPTPAAPQTNITASAPAEWQSVAGTQFRLLNYRFGQTGEVYVSKSRGGILPNLNRWLGQYGQPKVQSVADFEKVPVMGREGVIVDVKGKFAGGMGKPPMDNAGLLGLLADFDGALITVKMIGSAEEVAAEKERFITFCQSLEMPTAE